MGRRAVLPGEEREAEKQEAKKQEAEEREANEATIRKTDKAGTATAKKPPWPMPQYTNDTGFLRGAASANGTEHEVDLDDVYLLPRVHVRLLSLGKLKGQEWNIHLKDGGMGLRDREADVFAVVSRVDNV